MSHAHLGRLNSVNQQLINAFGKICKPARQICADRKERGRIQIMQLQTHREGRKKELKNRLKQTHIRNKKDSKTQREAGRKE